MLEPGAYLLASITSATAAAPTASSAMRRAVWVQPARTALPAAPGSSACRQPGTQRTKIIYRGRDQFTALFADSGQRVGSSVLAAAYGDARHRHDEVPLPHEDHEVRSEY